MRSILDYFKSSEKGKHVRVEVERDGKTFIYVMDWWGDCIYVYEGDELVREISEFNEINIILDKIAQKVIK